MHTRYRKLTLSKLIDGYFDLIRGGVHAHQAVDALAIKTPLESSVHHRSDSFVAVGWPFVEYLFDHVENQCVVFASIEAIHDAPPSTLSSLVEPLSASSEDCADAFDATFFRLDDFFGNGFKVCV